METDMKRRYYYYFKRTDTYARFSLSREKEMRQTIALALEMEKSFCQYSNPFHSWPGGGWGPAVHLFTPSCEALWRAKHFSCARIKWKWFAPRTKSSGFPRKIEIWIVACGIGEQPFLREQRGLSLYSEKYDGVKIRRMKKTLTRDFLRFWRTNKRNRQTRDKRFRKPK